MTLAYQFKPHERPAIPGSPFNPEHPTARMWAYGAIGVLAGLTGGLGNALVSANISYFQGTLGLTAEEAAWIPAAYATTYICANLILVKFRQQFGLQLFLKLVLVGYIMATLMHLVCARLLVRDDGARRQRNRRRGPVDTGRADLVSGLAGAQAHPRHHDRRQHSSAGDAACPRASRRRCSNGATGGWPICSSSGWPC